MAVAFVQPGCAVDVFAGKPVRHRPDSRRSGPTRLRRMFIELDDPKLRVEEHAGLLRREVYWHGPEETALTCADIWSPALSIRRRDRLAMLGHQVALLARRYAHLGRGQEMGVGVALRRRRSPKHDNRRNRAAGRRHGRLCPVPGYAGRGGGEDQGRSGGRGPHYLTAVAALRAGRDRPSVSATHDGSAPVDAAQEDRRATRPGYRTFFRIIAPVTTGEEGFLQLPCRETFPPRCSLSTTRRRTRSFTR